MRKYQAFISSTFRDLHEGRERITWEVLKIGFIPVGMENFSAVDERAWRTIAKAIDQSDYYVVIVAGLYGSQDENGKSWTQREYEYAREHKVPVLAFIREPHAVPGDMVEKGEAAPKLDAFIKQLRTAHLVETWSTVDDLRAKVPVALMKIAREDESEGRERPGWYRGPASAAALDELARLSAENRELRAKVEALGSEDPLVGKLRRISPGDKISLSSSGSIHSGLIKDLEVDAPNNRFVLRVVVDEAGREEVFVHPLHALDSPWRDRANVWRLTLKPA
jgi:hypothetical protein